MDFKAFKSIYFLGIGGIGMSALARYFNSMDIPVAGYDRTETRLTRALVDEGINVHYDDVIGEIPATFKNDLKSTFEEKIKACSHSRNV